VNNKDLGISNFLHVMLMLIDPLQAAITEDFLKPIEKAIGASRIDRH
jgi:hypothetical protein